MNKLALCVISSKEDLPKAVALAGSLKEFVDEAVITGPKEFKWINDFSAARAFNFVQTKADWILWLDADDSLEHPEKLRDLIVYAEQNRISGYYVRYKYGFDENGNCVDEHWKLQLVKNDGSAEWKGVIHEDLLQTRPVNWIKTELITRIHHTDKQRMEESYRRNLKMLEKAHRKNPKDPRLIFYLGRDYARAAQYQKAIDYLTNYLNMSGWDDERYEANMLIGWILKQAGKIDEALLTYNQAILEKETLPDAYANKGFCYILKEKYNEALYNFQTALRIPPNTSVNFNPMFLTRDVYAGISTCYANLGQLQNALKAIELALKADPKNQVNLDAKKWLLAEIYKYDTAQRYVKIAKFLDKPDKIQQLLATVPPSLADNEMILSLRNAFLPPKVWPKKAMAIYCGTTAESWTPDSLKKGLGGSETAVIELSKRLVKLGWQITVFNQCDAPPEGLVFDGVNYQNYWTFNIHDEFDVLWIWRLPEMYEYEFKARLKILDLHDTMSPADFTETRLQRIDKIMAKTNFHRSLYPKVPDEKFAIIGNGIDLTKFQGHEIRDPYRFVYASSPNRGLDILLEIWPKIKERLPKATLHVFYGWETFYKIEKNNPERMMWMKRMQILMKQDGVIDHGRVDQQTLAKEEMKSSFWLYPTAFPEIDCITVKEMQAAGVVPITTGFGALAENQIAGIKLEGDIYDPQWQEKYTEQVIRSAEVGQREQLNVEQFSWDEIVKKWDEICV